MKGKNRAISAASIFALSLVSGIVIDLIFPGYRAAGPRSSALVTTVLVAMTFASLGSLIYLAFRLVPILLRWLIEQDEREEESPPSWKFRAVRFFLIWLALTTFFGFNIYNTNTPTYRTLQARGVTTTGRELLDTQQFRMGYEYRVGGKKYLSRSAIQSLETLKPGKPVKVVYDPQAPTESAIPPLQTLIDSEIKAAVIGSQWLSIMPILCIRFFFWSRWKKNVLRDLNRWQSRATAKA
ncbi:hypothetical protein EON80_17245 [bacterium]|nr:MAG: hypothetical protein EON80_17245 [bacterium]